MDILALKQKFMRLNGSIGANESFSHPTSQSLLNGSIGHNSDPVLGRSQFSLASISPGKIGVAASILANHIFNEVRVKGRKTGIQSTYVSNLEKIKSRIGALE